MKKGGIIASVVVIAALAGGIAALSVPRGDESETESDAAALTESVLDMSEATAAEIKNEHGTLYLEKDGEWTLRGEDDTQQAKVDNLADYALVYKSENILTGSKSDYGLDEPRLSVTITKGDATHTVLVGDKSAVDNVYFASADGVIFTMYAAQFDALNEPEEFYSEFSRVTINTEDVNAITVERGGERIALTMPQITRMEGNVWHMVSPYETLASDTYIDENILPSIEMVSMYKKGEELGEVTAVVKVKESDKEYVFTLGETTDGEIAVEYDGAVYLEDAALFEFVNADLFDFVNKLVSYVHIADTSKLTVEKDGKSTVIEISGNDNDYKFKRDGEDLDTSEGKKMYMEVIGMEAMALYDGSEQGETLAKVTFTGKGDVEDTVVEYRAINEYSAAVVKNGTAIFIVNTDELEKLSCVFE